MSTASSNKGCAAGMSPLAARPVSVEQAICIVLRETEPLSPVRMKLSPDILGRTLHEDINAIYDFPPFAASIMDGYAVNAPALAKPYCVQGSIHAGGISMTDNEKQLLPGEVMYITTGAKLPDGANAVIKIEDTEVDESEGGQKMVRFLRDMEKIGENVREIGSDIKRGELLLRRGKSLRASDLGLLATAGLEEICCFPSPVIGVLSTGDELVDFSESLPIGGCKVRDCNRIALLSALKEDGLRTVDLGIVRDEKEVLRNRLLEAAQICDIVISSGGVSMGAADYIKPLLGELGQVHFGKLDMKPGKPTTFATLRKPGKESGSKVLFFGLPGNPVSCLVTKALFVDPAVKRLQGISSRHCLHPQLTVQLAGSDIQLDPERPEYHRAIVEDDCSERNSETINHSAPQLPCAYSTGNQRSSRILSMRSANALLFLPKGPGTIPAGSKLSALLIGQLPSASCRNSVHSKAARLDSVAEESELEGSSIEKHVMKVSDHSGLAKSTAKLQVRVGLLTISDRAAAGIYADKSGPEMEQILIGLNAEPNYPLRFVVISKSVVPDEPDKIAATVIKWCDGEKHVSPESGILGNLHNEHGVDFVLTTGGTGFGLRDLTPETLRPLLHREAPGIAQALLNEGLKYTPLAVLSRPVVGTRNKTFVCTLPGSVKAIRENMACMTVLLPRIFELLLSDDA